MPEVLCLLCNKEFHVKPSHQKMGYGKFCSIKCRSEGQKKGKLLNCHICSRETWKSPKEIRRSKSGLFFCDKTCQAKWRNKYYSGEKHANWKNGESTYRKELINSGRQMVCVSCGSEDKRILTAHHTDRDRSNNKVENLVWLCLNCHFIEHNYK